MFASAGKSSFRLLGALVFRFFMCYKPLIELTNYTKIGAYGWISEIATSFSNNGVIFSTGMKWPGRTPRNLNIISIFTAG